MTLCVSHIESYNIDYSVCCALSTLECDSIDFAISPSISHTTITACLYRAFIGSLLIESSLSTTKFTNNRKATTPLPCKMLFSLGISVTGVYPSVAFPHFHMATKKASYKNRPLRSSI